MNANSYAVQLIKKYDEAIESFSLSKQRHYGERLYRITGNEKYSKYIKNYYENKKTEISKLLNITNDFSAQKRFGRALIDELAKGSWKKEPRFLKRIPVYRDIPEFKYYYELSWYLSKLRDHKIEGWFSKDSLENAKLLLKDVDFNKYFLNEELMYVDPVQTINCVFNVRDVTERDFTEETVKFVEKLYSDTKSETDFIQKLYFYTHVIISESKYYQYPVYKYEYIFQLFTEMQEKIFKINTSDIVAEIGVCFKLQNNRNTFQIQEYQREVIRRLRIGHGILTYKNPKEEFKDISKVEHRNVLAIILLWDFKKFNIGPIL